MTQCLIHNHSSFERFTSTLDPTDLYGCSDIINDAENMLLGICASKNWVESGYTWGDLGTDEIVKMISHAFDFRDTFDVSATEYDQTLSMIFTLIKIVCANLLNKTGLTIDSVMLVRGSDQQITVNFSLCEMYSFGAKEKDDDFLKVVVDNSHENDN